MYWGLADLGPSLGYYLALGIGLAAVLAAVVPADVLRAQLGTSWLGLLAAALVGASMYVCAVAHIPLVASLLAAGAGPGAAIVFLVTGTATNLPELVVLYKSIGRRTVILYTLTLILGSVAAGIAVNLWLGPDYRVPLDPLRSLDLLEQAENWSLGVPFALAVSSAAIVIGLAAWGTARRLRALMERGSVASRARGPQQPLS
jgi:hypothetical protein